MNDQRWTPQFNPDALASEAMAYFDQHYNCAQAVFAPFANCFGMDLELAFKIATPFGGGMGHAGQVCGAITGALMAIGLFQGDSENNRENKYACYDLAVKFQAQFKELHGSLSCPGLLGWDIGIPQELAHVREEGLFHSLCPQLVGDAARIAGNLLLEDE